MAKINFLFVILFIILQSFAVYTPFQILESNLGKNYQVDNNSIIQDIKNENLFESPNQEKLLSNFIPKIQNGIVRNGNTFETAINLFDNKTDNRTLSNTSSQFYYRYYAQFPYSYINISFISNDTSSKIILLDQFQNIIISNIGNELQKIITIGSSLSSLKDNLRFIGWYYIKIESNNIPIDFEIKFNFLNGDGSSLWSPIIIKPGINAWNGIFKSRENTYDISSRDSAFYAFYVNLSYPEINYEVSEYTSISLYGPNMDYLTYNIHSGDWIAEEEGYYYLEVGDTSIDGKNITISLFLNNTNKDIGDSFDQPKEISRKSGIIDNLVSNFKFRFLKLYLFIGENVTIKIGNGLDAKYTVSIYGPWGLEWFETEADSRNNPINLNNVENSGYYILSVLGPIGSYKVDLTFNYKITEGISWQSAKSVNLDSIYGDQRYLLKNESYYYRINFYSGNILNISIKSINIKELYVYGKYQEILGFLKIENKQESIYVKNLTNSSVIFIKITGNNINSFYSLSISKANSNYNFKLEIDGNLQTTNIKTGINNSIPLINLYLMKKNSFGDEIVAITSTNECGNFSIVYDGDLTTNGTMNDFFIKVIFEGPALQLLSYAKNKVYDELFIEIEEAGLPIIHFNYLNIPDGTIWSYKIANIFTIITHGWLWIEHLENVPFGPPQIKLFYSSNSPGTFYQPWSTVDNTNVKYSINLLGYSSSDDDAWDDSVILHEYGHHIEQTFGITNNPGGSHYYSSTISPDMGHGEGFPTFYASVVLNSLYYRDSTTTGYDGINIESGRRSSTNSLNNRLEDLYGEFGETSVFALYYDLIDKNNTDDVNGDGIGDSTSLSVDSIFNILINQRKSGSLGITTSNLLYQELIINNIYDMDNISKTYYDHGNSFFSYPFILGGSNKIFSNTDENSNFTWQFFDSNPKTYEITVDSQIVKSGIWNFTEESILINIYQFNFTSGTRHIFKLKLSDTMDNIREYEYSVKIIDSYESMGINFQNSIDLFANEQFSTDLNKTLYFSYITKENELTNLTLFKNSTLQYNISIYDQNFVIINSYQDISNLDYIFVWINASEPIYIQVKYISGIGMFGISVKNELYGFSIYNPLNIRKNGMSATIMNNKTTNYYIKVDSEYSLRLLTLQILSNNILLMIKDENGKLYENLSLSTSSNPFHYFLPLNLAVTEISKFNPFPTYILEIKTISKPIEMILSLNEIQKPIISYSGDIILMKSENQSLNFLYNGTSHITYNVFINGKYFTNASVEGIQNNEYIIKLDISALPLGFLIVDIELTDFHGLREYFRFSVSLVSELTTMTNTSNNSISEERVSEIVAFFTLIVALNVFIISNYYIKKRRNKKISLEKKIEENE
jgi:hypothetical protein